jgi:hypothetical protein
MIDNAPSTVTRLDLLVKPVEDVEVPPRVRAKAFECTEGRGASAETWAILTGKYDGVTHSSTRNWPAALSWHV